MRIVHVIPHAGDGGDWVTVAGLQRVFREMGHEVHVYGSGADQKSPSGKHIPLSDGFLGFLRSLLSIKGIPSNVDVYHAHSLTSVAYCVMARIVTRSRARIVFTRHLQSAPSRGKRLTQLMLYWVDVIHVSSTKMLNTPYLGINAIDRKMRLALLGVSESRFSLTQPDEKTRIRKSMGIGDDQLVLLYVGRLAPEKGVHQLIEYVASCRRENVIALIVGSGASGTELKDLAILLGVESQVKFIPKVQKVEIFYSVADLLVLPSVSEAFGLVVIEAGLCGLPCVRSDLAGASDQIIDGETGFLYRPANSSALFERIERIVNEQVDLFEVGQRARAHAEVKFTESNMYQSMLQIYTPISDE